MPPSWQLSPARSRKDHSLQSQRWCCRRAVLYRHDYGTAGGPLSTATTMVLQAGRSKLPQRWCCRRAILYRRNDGAAGGPFSSAATMVLQRFPILGLKSRITARKMAFPGKTLHRFPSLGLKSRIDARISRSSARILSTSLQHAFITR